MDAPYKPHAPRKGNTALRYAVGIVIIAILFVVGLLPKQKNSALLESESKQVSTALPEVEVVSPRMAAADSLTLPGDIQAISETAIQPRTSGYIAKLYVDIGSHVKAGQVLADIESPDVDQQVAQANADTAKSRATVGQSQADVDRFQAGVLQSRADVSHQGAAVIQAQAALEGARSKHAQATAGLAQAKARLAQSQQQVTVQKAALTQAQAQFDLAAANVKRYAGLLEQGFVAQEDYDQAEATYKTTAATIDSAKASIEASRADVNAAEQDVHANEAMVRSATSDVDAAAANVHAANAALQSSSANLQASKSTVQAGQATVQANQAAVGSSVANARRYEVLRSFEHIAAPFEGIITARNVDVGALVSPGTTSAVVSNSATPTVGLFGISRVDTVRIYVDLPQSDYEWAHAGTKAKVFVREIPNTTFEGTVYQSAGALNSNTRTLLTEIHLPNPSGRLLPGMYTQVQFAGGGEKKLRVPSSALVVDANGSQVVVVDAQNRIHFRKVVIGRDYGTEAEVVSGVEPGDHLVANPSDDLREGQEVQVTAK